MVSPEPGPEWAIWTCQISHNIVPAGFWSGAVSLTCAYVQQDLSDVRLLYFQLVASHIPTSVEELEPIMATLQMAL